MEAIMALTSQSLTDDEKELYAKIEDKFPKAVNEIRRQIVDTQVKKNSSLSKKIAKEIRTRILSKDEFRNV
jgi:DNA replication initiation complex subunit (GINS family)